MGLLLGDATLSWPLLSLLIFLAETAVTTLDTVRTIFVARGKKALASLLGLVEISIWLFAISQVMQNLSNVACFIAYATGFTAGTFLGIRIEEALALGSLVIRIITNKDATDLVAALRMANFGVTSIDAHGANGPVHVIFTFIKRKELAHVVRVIERVDPTTFYSIEDLRSINGGVLQARQPRQQGTVPMPARLFGIDQASARVPMPRFLAFLRRRLTRRAPRATSPLRVQHLQLRAEPLQVPREEARI
jgi:uncharacterized protein YebE (UPF0316 family)